ACPADQGQPRNPPPFLLQVTDRQVSARLGVALRIRCDLSGQELGGICLIDPAPSVLSAEREQMSTALVLQTAFSSAIPVMSVQDEVVSILARVGLVVEVGVLLVVG